MQSTWNTHQLMVKTTTHLLSLKNYHLSSSILSYSHFNNQYCVLWTSKVSLCLLPFICCLSFEQIPPNFWTFKNFYWRCRVRVVLFLPDEYRLFSLIARIASKHILDRLFDFESSWECTHEFDVQCCLVTLLLKVLAHCCWSLFVKAHIIMWFDNWMTFWSSLQLLENPPQILHKKLIWSWYSL